MAGRYKVYPKYKDSGVEWFSTIPTHWKVAGFKKHISSIVDYRGKTPVKTDTGITLITARNIKSGKLNYDLSKEYISLEDYDDVMSRGVPKIGDLLFTTEAPLGEVAQVDRVDIALAQRVIKLRGQDNLLYNDYLKYLVISPEFQQSLQLYASGSTVKGIKAERLVYLRNIIPTYEEQQKIAAFLDHETIKIDTLIAKQEKLIELLKERRQAVISHAVTKGLNPDVPMKDSGIKWLGKVPDHWGVCLIKYLCKEITDGAHISPDTQDGKHHFISIKDIKKGIINFEESLLTSTESFAYLKKAGCMPFKGDILFSKDGTIGETAITPERVSFVVASSLIIIRPNKEIVLPKFLDLILQSTLVKEQVESFVKGAALRRLSIQNLLKVFGLLPPLHEQVNIVNHIYSRLSIFNALEDQSKTQVKLLHERKTALISAAVTGKIDVRDWQPPVEQGA